MRAERRADGAGRHRGRARRTSPAAQVPYGVDLAAAWAWRFLVDRRAPGYVLCAGHREFLASSCCRWSIALLIAALVAPVVTWLQRLRLPRGLAPRCWSCSAASPSSRCC